MRIFLFMLFSLIALSESAFAGGDVNRGEVLFRDQKLSGSSFGVSCNTCHPGGAGLEYAGTEGRKKWKSCSGEQNSLEDAINTCIMAANKCKPLKPESQEMKDLVAYVKTLTKRIRQNVLKQER